MPLMQTKWQVVIQRKTEKGKYKWYLPILPRGGF